MRFILITLLFIGTVRAFPKEETELGLIPPINLEFPSEEDPRLTGRIDSSSGDSDGRGSSCGGCGS